MAFGEHFERYRRLRMARNLSEMTLKAEEDAHRKLWGFLSGRDFGGDELEVKREDIQAYTEEVFGNPGLKANSKRILVGNLKYFFREAVRQEWMLSNPMKGVKLPAMEIPLIRVLTVKEMKTLLETPDMSSAVGVRDRAMMELLYSCGLRRSELLSLRRKSFDEDFETVRVMGKGNKEAVLPVGRVARHYLRFYVDKVFPGMNKQEQDFLFIDCNTGRHLSKPGLERNLRAYGKEAKLKTPLSPHVFRYSVCTHLAEEGVDIRLIQEFMRHDSINTTARYIRQSFERLQEVHRSTHPRALG